MVNQKKIEYLVREFLQAIGENPEREGVRETPVRVSKMCAELFRGVSSSAQNEIKIFDEPCIGDARDYIIIKDIPVYSVCEHHLLPFFGRACVVYIPKSGRVIGLSKIARVVDLLSKKLQLQERLTNEIADILDSYIEPKGIAVFVTAEHLCLSMRGIKAYGAKTMTASYRGLFEHDLSVRAEVKNMYFGNNATQNI